MVALELLALGWLLAVMGCQTLLGICCVDRTCNAGWDFNADRRSSPSDEGHHTINWYESKKNHIRFKLATITPCV